MFIYYLHNIQMRTLYSHFIHIICVQYLDYSSHKTQTLLLPDLMAAPWVDLGFLTGVGAVPDCFSFIFLLSHSSFSLHLCSSTASCIFSFFLSSSSLAPFALWLSCAGRKKEKVKAFQIHHVYKKNKCDRLKIYHARKP